MRRLSLPFVAAVLDRFEPHERQAIWNQLADVCEITPADWRNFACVEWCKETQKRNGLPREQIAEKARARFGMTSAARVLWLWDGNDPKQKRLRQFCRNYPMPNFVGSQLAVGMLKPKKQLEPESSDDNDTRD